MPRRLSNDMFSSALLPLTILDVGLWESDVESAFIRGDAVMARIFGLSPEEAAQGLPMQRLLSIFHRDDLAADTVSRRRMREEGGLFVWEHRIVPAPGTVRRVLSRGYFERDINGRMRGRGIIIDVTDTRADEPSEGLPRFLTASMSIGSPAERMAEHALELWTLRDELSADAAARLEPLLQAVMLELAREIASTLPEGRETAAAPSKGGAKLH